MIDNEEVRNLPHAELSVYLREKVEAIGEQAITDHLLMSIESQLVPPTVLSTWLTVTESPQLIDQVLRTNFSILARSTAVKHLTRGLRSKRWHELLETIGGAQGLVDHMARMSVSELLKTIKSFVSDSSTGPDLQERRELISRILKAFLDRDIAQALLRSHDDRNLEDLYIQLLPACTTDFVEDLVRSQQPHAVELLKNARRRRKVLHNHPKLLAKLVTELGKAKWEYPQFREGYIKTLFSSPLFIQGTDEFAAPIQALFNLLEDVVASNSKWTELDCYRDLIEPLARKIKRNKNKRGRTEGLDRLIRLSLTYFAQRDVTFDYRQLRRRSLLQILVSLWIGDADRYEDKLTAFLSHVRISSAAEIHRNSGLLKAVNMSHRYKLLRLCFLHRSHSPIDIDRVEDLAKLDDKTRWEDELFLDLDPFEALSLLNRVFEAFGSQTKLGEHSMQRYRYTDWAWASNGNTPEEFLKPLRSLLETILQRGTKDALQTARALIEDQKKVATKTRDQASRAVEVGCVLFMGTASGSPQLLGEALNWSYRYIRDPLTAKEIFGERILCGKHALQTLSGFPHISHNTIKAVDNGEPISAQQIKERIKDGNKALLGMLEALHTAKSEPSFRVENYTGMKNAMSLTVEYRMKNASRIQKELRLTDDETYDLLWPETISMLVESEQVSLSLTNVSQQLREAFDPSHGFQLIPVALGSASLPSTLRFVDDLAKTRDEVWQKYRPTVTPATTSISEPWPKGLAIQHIANMVNVAIPGAAGNTPYISRRAQEIVFMNRGKAMSSKGEFDSLEDEDDGVRDFIDSYGLALKIYVLQTASDEVKEEGLRKVWNHMNTAFRRDFEGISPRDQAFANHQALKDVLTRHLPRRLVNKVVTSLESYDTPLLPDMSDPNIPEEWNPDENRPSFSKLEKVRRRYAIDYMFLTGQSDYDLFYPHRAFTAKKHGQFGDQLNANYVPVSESNLNRSLEANIALSVLWIDEWMKPKTRTLRSAWPSTTEWRYPAVFLSSDYLTGLSESEAQRKRQSAVSTITSNYYSSIAPPSLLLNLATSVRDKYSEMSKSEQDKSGLGQQVWYLLRALVESDRPSFAKDLIVQVLLEEPDASSWHRVLLNSGLLKRLPPQQAHDLLMSVIDKIMERMDEQSKIRDKSPGTTTDNTTHKPIVKVTTVKYIAQLLREPEYISPQLAVSTLQRVLLKAKHIDIRTAAVDSLISIMLKAARDNKEPERKSILAFLESTIHIAGSLNERRPLSEEEWTDAEAKIEPPEIDGPLTQQGPIMSAILDTLSTAPWDFREVIMARLVLPIVTLSAQNNARWLRIFARKHALGDVSSVVLNVPVRGDCILNSLLSKAPLIRLDESLIHAHHALLMVNLAPPETLKLAIARLQKDTKFSSSNEGAYFLSLFARHANGLAPHHFQLPKLLFTDIKPFLSLTQGPTMDLLYTLSTTQAHTIIQHHATPSVRAWKTFLTPLNVPLDDVFSNVSSTFCPIFHLSFLPYSFIDTPTVLAYGFPFLRLLCTSINETRTSSWNSTRPRTPAVLPDTLRLEIFMDIQETLLDFRTRNRDKGVAAALKIAGYTATLFTRPEWADRRKLIHSATEMLPDESYAAAACALANWTPENGSAMPNLDAPDEGAFLRISLAHSLLSSQWNSSSRFDADNIRALLERWEGSCNERVRGVAYALWEKKIKNASGWEKEFCDAVGWSCGLAVVKP